MTGARIHRNARPSSVSGPILPMDLREEQVLEELRRRREGGEMGDPDDRPPLGAIIFWALVMFTAWLFVMAAWWWLS